MSGLGRPGGKRAKTALTEELNRALSAGLGGGVRMAISRTVVESQRWTSADICEASHVYEATQDVIGAGDILAMRRGEKVELLDDTDRSKKRRIRFEDTVEIVDVSDSYNHSSVGLGLLDCSAARHKASIRPRQRRPPSTAPTQSTSHTQPIVETPHDEADEFQFPATNGSVGLHKDEEDNGWLVRKASDPTQVGWAAPESLERRDSAGFGTPMEDLSAQSMPNAKYRRDAVVRELVETEEEFGRDMIRVVERYMIPIDRSSAPRVVRDNKDVVFSNLKEIAEFHQTVLIEGIKYYADEPTMIGKTFLRLERDFDKHVAYCRDEPAAQEFLQKTPEAKDYFEEISNQLGDDKSLSEHLKLPIQRINDYQLLLKELVRYSSRLNENTSDLSRALELMLAVPHKANDNKFISSIEGFQGNIYKLGRLLRHDWFTVSDREGRTKERYLFLFKARILICKVRRISDDRSVFVLKEIIRLPEVELKDIPDNKKSFELISDSGVKQIVARDDSTKDLWLKEIRLYAADFVALEEHRKDDLFVKPEQTDEEVSYAEPSKPQEATKLVEPVKQPAPEPPKAAEPPPKTVEPEPPKTPEPQAPKTPEPQVPKTPEPQVPKTPEPQVLKTPEPQQPKTPELQQPKTPEPQQAKTPEVPPTPEPGVRGETGLKRKDEATVQAEESIKKAKVEDEDEEMSDYVSRRTSSSSSRRYGGRTEVEAGETATFECSVSGSDATRMIWLKDNKPLDDKLADRVTKTVKDNKFSLEILNVHEQDTGLYTACATNTNGSSSCTAHMEVQRLTDEERKRRREANAPMFVVQLRDTELLENTYLRFMVKLKGNPNPTVRFYKNDRRILSTNDRVKIVDDESENGYYELVIPDVTQEDAGCYSCTASNEFGEEKCSAQLTVTDSKDVFAGLTEEEVKPGEQPHFTWTRNGQPYSPEDRFKVLLTDEKEKMDGGKKDKKKKKDEEDSLALVFQHVKPEDAGLYTCVAQTTSGKIACSAELTVQGGVNALNREPEKPKITVEAKTQEVSVGGSAMLELKVEGCPKPEVAWFKNGEEVTAGGRIRFLYEDDEGMSLIIKGVTPEDAGTYTVVAANDMGQDQAEVELLVKSPPKFKTKMKDQSCMTDETLRVTVEVEGTPDPELAWYKDGKEITEKEERFHVVKETTEKYTLIIEKVRLEDSGSYSIVARNEVSQTSEFYKVTVESPPFFTQKMTPRKCEMREGDFASFTVKVDGDPKPKVKWLKDGEELLNDERHIKIESDRDGVTHSLTIRGITREDMGRYTCVLDNSHGSTSDSALMFVHCEPKFKKKLKDVINKEGDLNIVFEVNVHAYPKPDIKWLHDQVEITERKTAYTKTEEGEVYLGETYRLTIKEVAVEQAGTYTVNAKNAMGETENSGNFKVLYVPKITKKLEDVSLDEDASLTLEIEANAVPIPDVTWYKDGQEVKADANVKISRDKQREENYSLTFNLIKGKDTGEYEARVSNDQGTSSTKCFVQVNKVVKKEEEEEEEEIQKITKVKKYDSEEEEEEKKEEEEKVKLKPEKVKKVEVDDEDAKAKKVEEQAVSPEDKKYRAVEIESGESVEKKHDEPKTPKIEDVADKEPYSGVTVVEVDEAYTVPVPRGRKASTEDFRNKLQLGIVEEPAETSQFSQESRLTVNRGVSIVSVYSDDERSPSPSSPERGVELELSPIHEKSREPSTPEVSESKAEPKQAERLERTISRLVSVEEEPKTPEVQGAAEPKKGLKLERRTSELKSWDGEESGSPVVEEEVQTSPKKGLKLERRTSELKSWDGEESGSPVVEKEVQTSPKKGLKLERRTSELKSWDGEESGSPVVEEVVQTSPKRGLKLERRTSELKSWDSEESGSPVVEEVVQTSPKKGLKLERRTSELKSWDGEESGSPVVEQTVQLAPKKGRLVQTASQEEEKVQSRRESVSSAKSVEEPVPQRGRRSQDEEFEDPEVEALLKRVERQRSRLEEILDKEDDRKNEAKPVIVRHNMQDRKIFESLTEKYTIHATAHPKPEVTWYKDNEVVTSNDYIKISEEGEKYTLEIKYTLIPRDEGTYKIKLENRLGEATQEATLSLIPVEQLRKPIIIEKLKNTECKKGDKAVLKAVITGDPVPDIKWWKDGKEILPNVDPNVILNCDSLLKENDLKECTYTLTVPAARHKDTGQYSLKATNKYGEAESSALLNILLRPEISGMKDQTGIPTELTQFEVVIISNPAPEVTWTKDDKPVVMDDHFESVADRENEKYSLLIHDTATDDHGVYAVTARNSLGDATKSAQLSLHTEGPSFVKDLIDRMIKDSSPVDFKVRANGVPKPKITWLKDGEEVKPEDDERITIATSVEGQVTSTLHIDAVHKSDVGKYTCVASNLVGKAETSALLSMDQAPPMVTIPLEKALEFDEGEPMELKAKIDGSPVPIAKWFKDGEEIKPDNEHIKLNLLPDGTAKLNIDEVKHNDGGAYKIVAINKNGEMESLCAVAVKPKNRKPSFSKPLEDANIQAGEPLKLEALVTAFPIPEVKWYKDGHPVRPSQAINFVNDPIGHVGLIIDQARPEDAGEYTVKVANKLGSIEGQAKVGVEEREKRPLFHTQLMPQKVVEGYPVRMEVKCVGHPPPTLTWTRNGEEIVPDGKKIKVIDLPDGSQALLIDKVGPEDAGEYAVTASNPKGSMTTSAPLDVQGKGRPDEPEMEPSFVHPLRDAVADEDAPLTMGALFVGNPIPDVVWSKDGVPITPSERVRLTCDGKRVGLEINPARLSDGGKYKCELSSPLGTASSEADGNVRRIYTPASFVQKFTDLQQVPSLDAKFFARITGNPKPSVAWFFNGKPIQESSKYHLKQDGEHICLYVKDCVPKDSGSYMCKIANSAGKDMCEADLEIVDKIEKKQKIEPPSFLKKIGDCEVLSGMAAKFTACINGFPEPEFEWFLNGKKLEPSNRIAMEADSTGLLRLIIKDTQPEDVGIYRCRIFNPHGEASCEAELRYDSLDSKPKRPIGDQYQDFNKHKSGVPLPLPYPPIISRMTDRQLTLSWRPSLPIGPRFPVTYQVEMCELPDGEWKTVRTGVRSCACEIHNLEPFRNYKFRIRVENKFGVSEPSPHCVTHREKLEPPPPRFYPYLEPGIDFRPETSPYFPKDFDIEKPPHDKYAQAPRFLRQEHDTQYGVKNHNCNLMWFVYGYPKPKMKYFFNDEEVEMGGRFSESYTRNGQATLFINKMLDRDVGWYEAVATNEHGEARQRVRLEIAEYPVFIKRPEETTVLLRKGCRLEARVAGVPYPEIKWFKDWKPLTSTVHCKISFVEPDTSHLHILDAMNKDEGLYSCTASNVAGSVSASAMVHVEEDERRYLNRSYSRPKIVRTHKEKPIGDAYDLGDELGRGTQGVTYHAVERSTGDNYAAKVMHGKGELRQFMNNELDIMSLLHDRRLIRLHDAFETPHSFTLITELAGGGELLDHLTRKPFYTEFEIAGYVRQLLEGLNHMHGQNIAHLGLTAGDLLISHPGGDSLKICDFGLARRISSAALEPLRYGMPEFVAPEVVNGEGVSTSADMWSVGILTYLLLSGRSLFRGENDRETLTRIREGKWEFDDELFRNYSEEARDFIKRLLVYQWGGRMNVFDALNHPWFNILAKTPSDPYKHSSDPLKNYYNSFKDWYNNASCRTWYRRRPLEGAFTHPSKMVYPPHERYTPERTPPREPYKSRNWEEEIHSGQPHDVSYEIGLIKSESHYQNGPDTYLLQLRDVDFPVRLRKYMKVAANRGPGYSRVVSDQSHLDWRAPVIRERRRFTDVMDEEIDDERKARINKYGGPTDPHGLRRLRHELGTRLDGHAEAEAMMQTKHEHEGQLPFFREKPLTIPIVANENVQISCFAVGDPKPVVQWYKCDMVIQETARVTFKEDAEGRSIMSLSPALNFDVGIYKVVARNKGGQTVARFRVVLAGVPTAPDSPEIADVSDNEVFLRWKQPKDDGNTPVLCYGLQYKEVDGDEWIDIAKNIDHEFFVVHNLEQTTRYYFRLAARNRIGWSDYGIPIKTKTKPVGVPKVQVTRAMQHLQQITESGAEVDVETESHKLNYSTENNPLSWIPESDLSDKYHFISEISRGRYSAVVKGIEKATNKVVAGKLLEIAPEREVAVNREFEALRTLRHERIASLIEAYRAPGGDVAVLILEKLQGADILTYFSSRHEYNEQMVCMVVSQILDGLQYLHWRGLCHLDLQPDNVVMASVRSVQVKLVDLGSAQTVSKLGTMVDRVGHIEYSSPEMLNDEPVSPQSDIWSLGVITYVLLSGVSPFRGENNEETRQNILFVRYRFEHLFKELSQEATRFLMLIFKRAPSKRPTPEECHEHRWLMPTEFMIKKRERAVFLGIRLKEFCDEYHTVRARQAMSSDSLVGAVDRRLTLTRSNSITEELGSFQNGHA